MYQDRQIPDDVIELYWIAKEAFVTYEQLTSNWELHSLARFRDALDHLMSAASLDPKSTERIEKLAQAEEHLTQVIAEPFKNAILEQVAEANKREKWIKLRQPFYQSIPSIQTLVRSRKESIDQKVAQARMLQGDISTDHCRDMFQLLLEAFNQAVELRATVEALGFSRRSWFAAPLWILLTAIGIAGLVAAFVF